MAVDQQPLVVAGQQKDPTAAPPICCCSFAWTWELTRNAGRKRGGAAPEGRAGQQRRKAAKLPVAVFASPAEELQTARGRARIRTRTREKKDVIALTPEMVARLIGVKQKWNGGR